MCIRQPSLGPVFGIKGGAAGGGYSQVIPMEDFNLHLTGDVHAIGAAHNLAAAFLDNHLHHKNVLGIDQHAILWPRVVDISDRAVRRAVIGLGGRENGVPRETEWVITVASEVMAVLALATDLQDLRARLGRIVLATTTAGTPVTCEDLGVAGSMTVLLIDAIKPNLLQTLEGGPAFVHCGPFANIAHGNNSIIADRLALATNEIVCTEAGFGADMGAEKFFDIKCRASGLRPDAAVVVATIRALKMHGGVGRIVAGKPLDPALLEENVEAVRAGGANLAKQIENVRLFNVPVVVAINSFPTDTAAEVEAIKEVSLAAGARDAVVATHFTDGGRGAMALAEAVWDAAEEGAPAFQLLYPDSAPLIEKIETIAEKVYGADGIDVLPAARKALTLYEELGFGSLPVCMAKTQYSLSHDAALKGRPSGFRVPIREVRLSAGAGFITPLVGRDAHDARAAVASGRREDRHRRRRERGRAVLGRRAGRLPRVASALEGAGREREAGGDHDRNGDATDPRRPQADVGRTEGLLVVAVRIVAVRGRGVLSGGGSSCSVCGRRLLRSLIAGILARGRGERSRGGALAAACARRGARRRSARRSRPTRRPARPAADLRRAARAFDCRLSGAAGGDDSPGGAPPPSPKRRDRIGEHGGARVRPNGGVRRAEVDGEFVLEPRGDEDPFGAGRRQRCLARGAAKAPLALDPDEAGRALALEPAGDEHRRPIRFRRLDGAAEDDPLRRADVRGHRFEGHAVAGRDRQRHREVRDEHEGKRADVAMKRVMGAMTARRRREVPLASIRPGCVASRACPGATR